MTLRALHCQKRFFAELRGGGQRRVIKAGRLKTKPIADNRPPPLTRAELAELLGGWKGYQPGTGGDYRWTESVPKKFGWN